MVCPIAVIARHAAAAASKTRLDTGSPPCRVSRLSLAFADAPLVGPHRHVRIAVVRIRLRVTSMSTEKFCTSCGAMLPAGAQGCPGCRRAADQRCPSCDQANHCDDHFCDACCAALPSAMSGGMPLLIPAKALDIGSPPDP